LFSVGNKNIDIIQKHIYACLDLTDFWQIEMRKIAVEQLQRLQRASIDDDFISDVTSSDDRTRAGAGNDSNQLRATNEPTK